MIIPIISFLNAVCLIVFTSVTILQLGDTSFAAGRVGIIACWIIYFASALVLQVALERKQSN